MSHLRTPLNAIIGNSEILQEEALKSGLEDIIPDTKKIYNAGKHLQTLINHILELSKIEAGRMELYLENFDLGNLIEEVVAALHPLVEKNHNQLQVSCSGNLGVMYADLTKFRQILFNLLSNALKFTEGRTVLRKRDSLSQQVAAIGFICKYLIRGLECPQNSSRVCLNLLFKGCFDYSQVRPHWFEIGD
jgi:signal transduction histidine kinase